MAEGLSDEMAAKVHDLLDTNSVVLVSGYEDRAAVVRGRTNWYTVKARPDGVDCECQVNGTCSHQLAAMVVWAEAMRDPFSGVLLP